MPPKRGAKKNSKKAEKAENYVRLQKEQSEHDSETESNHEANGTSQSDDENHRVTRKLSYPDADGGTAIDSNRNEENDGESDDELNESAESMPLHQNDKDMPPLSSAEDESEPENEKGNTQTELQVKNLAFSKIFSSFSNSTK